MKAWIWFLLGLVLSIPAHAQPAVEYEQFLLPLVLPAEGLRGARDSLWRTRLLVRNDAEAEVSIQDYEWGCPVPTCPPPPPAAPGVTFAPRVFTAPPYAVFLFIDRRYSRDVEISLTVQDLSRQATHRGTSLPVVPVDQFRDRILLLDLPVTGDFRTMIRVHSISPTARVRVTLYAFDPSKVLPVGADTLLGEREFDLVHPSSPQFSARFPASLALPDLKDLAPVGSEQRVNVEIERISGEPIWGFASITHNETQHVTIVSPRSR